MIESRQLLHVLFLSKIREGISPESAELLQQQLKKPELRTTAETASAAAAEMRQCQASLVTQLPELSGLCEERARLAIEDFKAIRSSLIGLSQDLEPQE